MSAKVKWWSLIILIGFMVVYGLASGETWVSILALTIMVAVLAISARCYRNRWQRERNFHLNQLYRLLNFMLLQWKEHHDNQPWTYKQMLNVLGGRLPRNPFTDGYDHASSAITVNASGGCSGDSEAGWKFFTRSGRIERIY